MQEWSVSLCSLSIRLDSEVLTHPEIPIPMGTCPRKAGAGSSTPPGFQPPPAPLVRFLCHAPRSSPALLDPPSLSPALPPEWPAINSAVSRYAQFSRCIKIHGLQSAPANHNAIRRQRLRRTASFVPRVCPPPSPSPSPPTCFPLVQAHPSPHPPKFFGVHFVSSCRRASHATQCFHRGGLRFALDAVYPFCLNHLNVDVALFKCKIGRAHV